MAFSVNEQLDEVDYPVIYDKPHPAVVATLQEHADALDMYIFHLPDRL